MDDSFGTWVQREPVVEAADHLFPLSRAAAADEKLHGSFTSATKGSPPQPVVSTQAASIATRQ